MADRLATACWNGDLLTAKAAVADGASVHDLGMVPTQGRKGPLEAAVTRKHHDVVVWLLSQGADPNGHKVMACAAYISTTDILQLLVDAGGDVNMRSDVQPPVFHAMRYGKLDNVRVLLAQPSFDFTTTYDDTSQQQFAIYSERPDLIDMLDREVRWRGRHHCYCCCLSTT